MSAALGSYFTPFSASGISTTMMIALKITADKIADCGECRYMMFSTPSTGNTPANIAGMMAKYFAIIPAMFAGVFPVLGVLNIMYLHSPQSAILSAVIFNAVIIVALIPLALKGVK